MSMVHRLLSINYRSWQHKASHISLFNNDELVENTRNMTNVGNGWTSTTSRTNLASILLANDIRMIRNIISNSLQEAAYCFRR